MLTTVKRTNGVQAMALLKAFFSPRQLGETTKGNVPNKGSLAGKPEASPYPLVFI